MLSIVHEVYTFLWVICIPFDRDTLERKSAENKEKDLHFLTFTRQKKIIKLISKDGNF